MSIIVLLARTDVEALAGYRAYGRGIAYHGDGRVELRSSDDATVTAMVRGTLPYRVELRDGGGLIGWSCSCPAAEDGSFCKHCVAVAAAAAERALEGGGVEAELRRSRPSSPAGAGGGGGGRVASASGAPTEVDVADYVASLGHDELVDIVLAQAAADRRLNDRLTALAAAEAGAGIVERDWRQRLDEAFCIPDDRYGYWDPAAWSAEVLDAVGSIGDLVDAGHPEAAMRLAEHAHRLLDDANDYVDGSDGCLSEVSYQLGRVHLRACTVARPDPADLARRLLDLELRTEHDTFHQAARTYAEVLGPVGLAEYRRSVATALATLGPEGTRWSYGRSRLRQARDAAALATGDPDELISAKRDDLIHPGDYRQIADLLRAVGRVEEAATWACDGLEALADHPHLADLEDLLADLLLERGDIAATVDIYRQAFLRRTSIGTYRRLRSAVERTGEEGGDGLTAWAIGVVGDRLATEEAGDDGDRGRPARLRGWTTLLVEIPLHDGEIEQAWRAASTHGCDERLWASLAVARGATHPLDAVAVHRRHALDAIEGRSRRDYESAVKLLDRIHRLAGAAGQPEVFSDLVAEIRAAHKAKRSLMALLDQQGRSLGER